jgi:hypothetical protein
MVPTVPTQNAAVPTTVPTVPTEKQMNPIWPPGVMILLVDVRLGRGFIP